MNSSIVHISVCQFKVEDNKVANILKAKKNILQAYNNSNTDIIVLPECFVCPYDINIFKENSENLEEINEKNSPAAFMLKTTSIVTKDTYIIGGSIIEKVYENISDVYYNTCLVFYNGELIGKYRKNNLYKINLSEHSYCEADVLTHGNLPTIVETKFGKIGIGICYDLRFNELSKYYQENGCKIIVYPGSFNRYTGPMHWLILQQVRAIDNQIFVVSCSSACNHGSSYESHGKSYIISPWGRIIQETQLDKEEIINANIDLGEIPQIKKALPILF